MSKMWEQSLVASGTNMVLDITAANAPKVLKRIQALKDAGYTVHMVHSDVALDEAIASAIRRAVDSSPVEGKLGRIAPEEMIRQMAGEHGGDDKIEEAIPEYASAINGSIWSYRNYPLSRQPPVLVFSKRFAQAIRKFFEARP